MSTPAPIPTDPVEDFARAIADAGIKPPDEIHADGDVHRFATNGKRGDDAGWYVLHLDGIPAGVFGDWRSDVTKTWCARRIESLSPAEREEHRRRIKAARREAEAERARAQEEAVKRAAELWARVRPETGEHRYLRDKHVQAHGIRTDGERLLIPMRDAEGKPWNLQRIAPDGTKRFLPGGRTKGLYFGVGRPGGVLVIAEGFATAASIHEATGHAVAVAFSAGNLRAVAEALRKKLGPDVRLIIAGDNDANGTGQKAATEAARAVGGLVVIPTTQGDWNDTAKTEGPEAVRKGIEAAVSPSAKDNEEWPALIPLESPELPRLNVRCLPAWAGDFARALADHTETPFELAAGMVLASCSVAAARRLRVLVKPGYSEPCNLWWLVALPSGSRKSAAQKFATAPLLAWEQDQAVALEPEIKRKTSERRTMEEQIKVFRRMAAAPRKKGPNPADPEECARKAAELDAALPEIPTLPRLWTSDATPEKLGVLLADHGECMAWLSSEGGVFDLLAGRYSNGVPNLDLVLKAHAGDAERVDRGSRPSVFVQCPRLTVGLSPQPDVLRGLTAKPGFRGRGLLARFLYLLPPSNLGFRTLESVPIHEGVRDAYAAGLRAMLDWQPDGPHFLRLSDAARSEHHVFARAIEDQMRPGGELEHCTDWAGKAPGAAARLAGVLHGIEHAHGRPWEVEITAETMSVALETMAVIMRHSLAALDLMGADPTVAAARNVWAWVKRGRIERFTVREAFNALRGHFNRVQPLRETLTVLDERGYLRVVEPQIRGPGRPSSPEVIVRPGLGEG